MLLVSEGATSHNLKAAKKSAQPRTRRRTLSYFEQRDLVRDLTGKSPSRATLGRWRSRGIKLPDGRVVRLNATRVGGRYAVGENEILDFLIATAGVGTAA